MGYTHYWTLKKGCNNPEKFALAVNLFKECWENAPKTLAYEVWDDKEKGWKQKRFKRENLLKGGLGEGEPTITDTRIHFNGDAKYDLDHETFHIDLADFTDEENTWRRRGDGSIWDFCKTAEKPYDLAVCLALLSFKEIFGDDFEYSSDGVTRENIKNPENLKYWESINWKPRIEWGWKRAYKVFDKVIAEREKRYVSAMAR